MLLSHRVIELERSQTSASHEQESDVLDILNVFLIGVLRNRKLVLHQESYISVKTNVKDLKDVRIADH